MEMVFPDLSETYVFLRAPVDLVVKSTSQCPSSETENSNGPMRATSSPGKSFMVLRTMGFHRSSGFLVEVRFMVVLYEKVALLESLFCEGDVFGVEFASDVEAAAFACDFSGGS